VRFIVADDHALVREGLAQTLEKNYSNAEVVAVADGNSLMIELEKQATVSLVLLDLKMPNTQPFLLLREISAKWPSIKLVVLSASEDQSDVDLAFENGARGFIPKSTPTQTLLSVVNQILKGKMYVPELSQELPSFVDSKKADPDEKDKQKKLPLSKLITKRQMDVLKLLVKGKTNRIIAQDLELSECTIKIHIANIFKVLEVSNRTEAVIKARHYRLSRR